MHVSHLRNTVNLTWHVWRAFKTFTLAVPTGLDHLPFANSTSFEDRGALPPGPARDPMCEL